MPPSRSAPLAWAPGVCPRRRCAAGATMPGCSGRTLRVRGRARRPESSTSSSARWRTRPSCCPRARCRSSRRTPGTLSRTSRPRPPFRCAGGHRAALGSARARVGARQYASAAPRTLCLAREAGPLLVLCAGDSSMLLKVSRARLGSAVHTERLSPLSDRPRASTAGPLAAPGSMLRGRGWGARNRVPTARAPPAGVPGGVGRALHGAAAVLLLRQLRQDLCVPAAAGRQPHLVGQPRHGAAPHARRGGHRAERRACAPLAAPAWCADRDPRAALQHPRAASHRLLPARLRERTTGRAGPSRASVLGRLRMRCQAGCLCVRCSYVA